MKGYLSYIKNGFMDNTVHKMHVFVAIVTNILYMIIVYFLWKAIYNGRDYVSSMSFNQIMIYMSASTALVGLFQTYTENFISCRLIYGSIIMDMIKPIDFQMHVFCRGIGTMIFNFFCVTLPVLLFSAFVLDVKFIVGFNIFYFIVSLINAVILCSILDFIVGLTSFYTESIWGITVIKDVLISVLASIYVPLEFYPQNIKMVIDILPFKAIYYTPLKFLTDNEVGFRYELIQIAVQLFWIGGLTVLSRIAFKHAFRNIVYNGG